jgi:hypothetical protein
MKYKSAKNLEGFIIFSSVDVQVFRVYNKDKSFTDFNIDHADLKVKIIDDDAFLTEDGRLDYSNETLGK